MNLKIMGAGLVFSFSLLAAETTLVQRSLEQVSAAKLEVNAIIKSLGSQNLELSKKLNIIQRRLASAEQGLKQSVEESAYPAGSEEPGQPQQPASMHAEMSAKCEIDDDPDFTPGQILGKTLMAESVQELISECDAVAKASGVKNYSSAISNVKVVNKPLDYVQATCEIDDDLDFTSGQFLVGEIVGKTFLEISAGCKSIAKATYGAKGSAGIKNPKIDATAFAVTAECHLDDDPDFTEGQIVFGKIGGASLADVTAQCAALAKEMYGEKGSSGLRGVVQ